MIGTDRSFEHRAYATRRSHLAIVLPMSRDLRRVRAALTNPNSRNKPSVAWTIGVLFAILFCIGVAL